MDKTLKEIHDIREKIYEEEKGLTYEELLKKHHEETERILKEWNIHLRVIDKEPVNSVLLKKNCF
jgi:hypothetical protein